MAKDGDKSPNTMEQSPSKDSAPDYAPKKLSRRDQIVFLIKLAAIGGAIFLLLWLFEKYTGY